VALIQSLISASLPAVIETIEVRSRFSPPVVLKTAELLKPSGGPPSPVVRQVKPTIILKGGTIGQQVIAPGGVASPTEWRLSLALLGGGLVAVGALAAAGVFMAGRRSGKQARALEGVDLEGRHLFAIGVASSVLGGLITAKIVESE
jgi:hypothetical protein